MNRLVTYPNIARPDDVYAMLIGAHDGLTAVQSRQLDAALILTLINQIGDASLVAEAIDLAKGAATNGAKHPALAQTQFCPVRRLCEAYIAGVAAGDGEAVSTLFHEAAVMTGTLNGELISGPVSPFFSHVSRTPQGSDYLGEVTQVEVTTLTAIATIRERNYSGMDFINWFHLARVGERWLITSKLFAQT